jgi:thioredoxin 1/putative thioredoxin
MSLLSGSSGPKGGDAGQKTSRPGSVPTLTEREFEAAVLQSEGPVLIVFSAEWSAPCRQVAPEIDAFAVEMSGKVSVAKFDIDRSPTLARELRVTSVPTFMVFSDRRIVDMVAGPLTRQKMRQMVEPFLPRSEGAVQPLELLELLRSGEVVPIDTRDEAAFKRAHLPGAVHFALDQIELRLAELHMLPARPVLYCRSGDQTKALAERLAEQEMPVAYLERGLLGWEAEGLPVERP